MKIPVRGLHIVKSSRIDHTHGCIGPREEHTEGEHSQEGSTYHAKNTQRCLETNNRYI